MVWEHTGRMHWTCKDMPGIFLDVMWSERNKKMWLFCAFNEDGEVLSKSTHDHPIDAMKAAEAFKETYVVKEETTRSKSEAPKGQASSAV